MYSNCMHSAIYSMLNKEDCQQNSHLTIKIKVTLIEIHGQETSELWLSTESNFVHQLTPSKEGTHTIFES
jgi:hypothetical protein